MTVAIVVDIPQFEALQQRLARLSNTRIDELMEAVGAVVESQTRGRISEERKAPDGTPWAPWTEGYKATRHGGHRLLQAEGHLMDSLQSLVTADGVEVGSNLIYARIHQLGGEPVGMPIPARPYLGLSPENARELEEIIEAHFAEGTP